jgi:hypothetical protein
MAPQTHLARHPPRSCRRSEAPEHGCEVQMNADCMQGHRKVLVSRRLARQVHKPRFSVPRQRHEVEPRRVSEKRVLRGAGARLL